MTVQEAVQRSGIDAREARLLLALAAGCSEASVVAFPERELPPAAGKTFLDFASRRARGEPVAYILGRKEFYGLEFEVTPAVLIPRPETELLVELALRIDFRSLLDLGTGSGAIALAIKHRRPDAQVVAVDESAAALQVARRNAGRLGLEVDFRHGCWFAPLPGERFEVIVSNPPYVAAGDPHLADLSYEPASALVSGADGLQAIRQVLAEAVAHLTPGGSLYLEHGLGQDAAVRELCTHAGLAEVTSWPDLSGTPRVTGGKRR